MCVCVCVRANGRPWVVGSAALGLRGVAREMEMGGFSRGSGGGVIRSAAAASAAPGNCAATNESGGGGGGGGSSSGGGMQEGDDGKEVLLEIDLSSGDD